MKKLKRAVIKEELVELTGDFSSCLVPMFFPKFNNNKPMSLWSRPHAIAMMSIAPNASITIQSSRQIGKCLTGDTLLHCKDSSGTVSDIPIGQLFDESE